LPPVTEFVLATLSSLASILAKLSVFVKEQIYRFRLYLVVSYTSPLAPLQPILSSIAGDFLAGEGRLLERGLRLLSELTPPLKQIMNGYKR
jgi:hypothetical protein